MGLEILCSGCATGTSNQTSNASPMATLQGVPNARVSKDCPNAYNTPRYTSTPEEPWYLYYDSCLMIVYGVVCALQIQPTSGHKRAK